MIPVIALVGRPNVGKSTLFNQLTRSRDALVANLPGLTRDRKYGEARIGNRRFVVIDTGGISGDEEGIESQMAGQSLASEDGVHGAPETRAPQASGRDRYPRQGDAADQTCRRCPAGRIQRCRSSAPSVRT